MFKTIYCIRAVHGDASRTDVNDDPNTNSVGTKRLFLSFFLLLLLLFNVESRSANNVTFFAVVDQIGTRAMNEDHLNDNRGYVCIVIRANRHAFPVRSMASLNDFMIEEMLLFRSSLIRR